MDEYEEEQNDIPPIGVSDEFRNAVLDAKNKLYNAIIFGPQLGTREAQSLTLIKTYLFSFDKCIISIATFSPRLDVRTKSLLLHFL